LICVPSKLTKLAVCAAPGKQHPKTKAQKVLLNKTLYIFNGFFGFYLNKYKRKQLLIL